MDWKDNFKEGKELVLATCSKESLPNANIAISLGFIDGRLLIADCQMKTTIKNLRDTKQVCIISKYLRLKGEVEIFSSGKYFDLCKEKNKEYEVNNAILVTPKEVYDLNKGKKIL